MLRRRTDQPLIDSKTVQCQTVLNSTDEKPGVLSIKPLWTAIQAKQLKLLVYYISCHNSESSYIDFVQEFFSFFFGHCSVFFDLVFGSQLQSSSVSSYRLQRFNKSTLNGRVWMVAHRIRWGTSIRNNVKYSGSVSRNVRHVFSLTSFDIQNARVVWHWPGYKHVNSPKADNTS